MLSSFRCHTKATRHVLQCVAYYNGCDLAACSCCMPWRWRGFLLVVARVHANDLDLVDGWLAALGPEPDCECINGRRMQDNT